jgi:hypothetical protein
MSVEKDTVFIHGVTEGADKLWAWVPRTKTRRNVLTGNRDFLLHDLPKLLEDVPLAVRARIWNMHDGASAHFSRALQGVLHKTCHDRWIRNGSSLSRNPNPGSTWPRKGSGNLVTTVPLFSLT